MIKLVECMRPRSIQAAKDFLRCVRKNTRVLRDVITYLGRVTWKDLKAVDDELVELIESRCS